MELLIRLFFTDTPGEDSLLRSCALSAHFAARDAPSKSASAHWLGFPNAIGSGGSPVVTVTENSSLQGMPFLIRIRTRDRILYFCRERELSHITFRTGPSTVRCFMRSPCTPAALVAPITRGRGFVGPRTPHWRAHAAFYSFGAALLAADTPPAFSAHDQTVSTAVLASAASPAACWQNTNGATLDSLARNFKAR